MTLELVNDYLTNVAFSVLVHKEIRSPKGLVNCMQYKFQMNGNN